MPVMNYWGNCPHIFHMYPPASESKAVFMCAILVQICTWGVFWPCERCFKNLHQGANCAHERKLYKANLKNIFVSPYPTLFLRYGSVGRSGYFIFFNFSNFIPIKPNCK